MGAVMKKSFAYKRPSKSAINNALEFYRTEAKNADEQSTVPGPICAFTRFAITP